jgi:hypothetical protein
VGFEQGRKFLLKAWDLFQVQLLWQLHHDNGPIGRHSLYPFEVLLSNLTATLTSNY